MIRIVLVRPENPYNTGAVARTCVAAGGSLHLVGPLGFEIGKRARRASMGYLDHATVSIHADLPEFLASVPPSAELVAFSDKGTTAFTEHRFGPDPWLLFGSESQGLPLDLPLPYVHIPMPGFSTDRTDHREHSLNVGVAVGIGVYEVLRQLRQP